MPSLVSSVAKQAAGTVQDRLIHDHHFAGRESGRVGQIDDDSAPTPSASASATGLSRQTAHAPRSTRYRKASDPRKDYRGLESNRSKGKERLHRLHRRDHQVSCSEQRHESHTTIVITPAEDTHPCARHHRRTPSVNLVSTPSPSPAVEYIERSTPRKSHTDFPSVLPSHQRPDAANMRSPPLNLSNPSPITTEKGSKIASRAPDPVPRGFQGNPPFAPDILDEMLEIHDHEVQAEARDTVCSMRGETEMLGVLQMGLSHSSAGVGSPKPSADKVLGLDPHAKLASLYLVSGLPRVSWNLAILWLILKNKSLIRRTTTTGRLPIPKPHWD